MFAGAVVKVGPGIYRGAKSETLTLAQSSHRGRRSSGVWGWRKCFEGRGTLSWTTNPSQPIPLHTSSHTSSWLPQRPSCPSSGQWASRDRPPSGISYASPLARRAVLRKPSHRAHSLTAKVLHRTHSQLVEHVMLTICPLDPNLLASQTASPTYPPQSMKSLPRPKESRASHRTKHPRPNRHYPTRHPTHTPVQHARLTPTPVEPLPATQCAPNLPYFVTRSRNNELPIYTLRKRGGNLPMTRVKNVDGRAEALKEELAGLLGLGRGEAAVNDVTGHVVLKGHHKPAVEKFLRERMF